MFTGSEKDRRIMAHRQAEMRQQADDWRLAHAANPEEALSYRRPKRLVRLVMIVMALVVVFVGTQQVFAQGAEPRRPDAGGPPEPFFDAMKAYREGLYYMNRGEYARSVDRLQAATEGIPGEVMAVVPAYQDMYWALGEAQEAAGQPLEALASYQRWLWLAGDEATPWAVAKVQALDAQLGSVMVALTRPRVSSYSH